MSAIITISDISQIVQTGNVVVIVLVETRAPCRKFLNTFQSAIGMVETQANPIGASYFLLPMSDVVKAALSIRAMPVAIAYKDGTEVKRIEGHFTSQFEFANFLNASLSGS